jgi:hypothetical protein
MSDLVKVDKTKVVLEPVAVQDVQANIQAIQEVMASVMKKGTHYDTIQGCGDKPVLLKPGAEKILSTFQIGTEIHVEDLGDGYDFRYRITVKGFHIPTGNTIGYGVGECSTKEKKYAWRAAVCDEEFNATPVNKRQEYWKPIYKKDPICVKQVRSNPPDISNTVLKMAKKRAMIDLCLTATACSDIFEQDLDEGHIRDAVGVAPTRHYQEPQAAQQQSPNANPFNGGQQQQAPAAVPPPSEYIPTGNEISEGQGKRLYAITMNAGKDMNHVVNHIKKHYGYMETGQIQKDKYEEICIWAEGK